jgi:hypothetical protein
VAPVEVDAERAETGHLSLLHAEPVVLHAVAWELEKSASALWTVLEALPRRRSHLLVTPMWDVNDAYIRGLLGPGLHRVQNDFEHVQVTMLATTATDVDMLTDMGIAALHFSQNAFVREDMFFPIPGRRPAFDAIYDAKWADYKRHPLASNVKSLALIAYPLPQVCTIEYFQNALAAVAHATWFTKPWVGSPHHLSPLEVNNVYNQSRVGLMLSDLEGANFASIQYLLAGLPVVTTHNEGGRDEFLSCSVARWVDDNPAAVAAGVAKLVKQDIDPGFIRSEALRKVSEHRVRLLSWMQRAVAEDNDATRSTRSWSSWPPDVPNKGMAPGVPVNDVVGRIREPAQTRPWIPRSQHQPRVILSEDELVHFREQGFVVVDRPLITPDEVTELRGLLDELLARFDDLEDDVAYDLGDTKLHEGLQQIPEIGWPTKHDPRIGATVAFARCQELAHRLLSAPAVCTYDHAIYKPPSRADNTVDWHQDVVYAPSGEVKDEVHIWLALQDVDETNGCMRYLPTPAGTGLRAHHRRARNAHAMVLDEVDTELAVACPIKAGMATAHLPATPHATGPNTSDQTRVAWALHFRVDGG